MKNRIPYAFYHSRLKQARIDALVYQFGRIKRVIAHEREAYPSQSRDRAVAHYRDSLARKISQQSRRERNKGEPQKEEAIEPQQSAVGSLEHVEEMVVGHPPNADD